MKSFLEPTKKNYTSKADTKPAFGKNTAIINDINLTTLEKYASQSTSDLERAIDITNEFSEKINNPKVQDIINDINERAQYDDSSLLSLIACAINELGYTEGSSNDNWNKYAEYFKNYPGFYSGDKQNVS